MIKRKIHPNKEIEAAIQFAESKGWRFRKGGRSAHTWGLLYCPLHKREGCNMPIWSTPSNPDLHATQIRQRVKSCPHEIDCK